MDLTFLTYAILLFTASDFNSITSHIHNLVVFLLWLCLCILSGVTSSPFSSSNYRPGEFIFQHHTYLFAFSYYSWDSQGKNTEVVCHSLLQGPHFVRTLYHDLWVALHGMAHSFIELDKAVDHVIRLLIFCDYGF